MSFLTLFTSDAAAAAHGHEFSPPFLAQKETAIIAHVPSAVSMVPEEPSSAATTTTVSPVSAPRPRPPRTKTSYHLAQPPPSAHHRHSLGSQRALLVQVQQLSKASRPTPVVDVLPAYFYGSKLKKVGQCFKNGISQQDLVLVASEEYDTKNGVTDDEDTSTSRRRIVGAVTQSTNKALEDGRKPTIITIGDGTQWEVNPLASGGYEFVSHCLDGTMQVAKWLPKSASKRRSTISSIGETPEERKFQFSISDPATRKRPIVAWLTPNNIDVLDKYPRSSATPRSTPITSPHVSQTDLSSPLSPQTSHEDVEYIPVSEMTKMLIIATGIWVTLKGRTQFSPRTNEPSSPLASLRPNLMSRATFASTISSVEETPPSFAATQRNSLQPAVNFQQDTRPRRSQSLNGISRGIGSLSRSLTRRPQSTLYESRPSTPERPISCILPKGVIPDLERVQPTRKSMSLPNSPTRRLGVNRAAAAVRDVNEGLSLVEGKKKKRGFRGMMSMIFKSKG